MCGFALGERKQNTDHRKLLDLEAVSLSWFGQAECKGDVNWQCFSS